VVNQVESCLRPTLGWLPKAGPCRWPKWKKEHLVQVQVFVLQCLDFVKGYLRLQRHRHARQWDLPLD
jgi:hypothetical protein